jgi:hypothetical protein
MRNRMRRSELERNQVIDSFVRFALVKLHLNPRQRVTLGAQSSRVIGLAETGELQYLLPSGTFKDGKAAQQHEGELIDHFQSKGDDAKIVLRRSGGRKYYYVPIRAKKSCMTCHGETTSAAHEGDLLAILKLESSG